MNAYENIGYACRKLNCSLAGKSWFTYKLSTGAGIPEAINYLWYQYQNNLFTSTDDIDITELARVYYRLSKFSELSSLNLFTKAD